MKRGDHRCYIAVRTARGVHSFSLTLAKVRRAALGPTPQARSALAPALRCTHACVHCSHATCALCAKGARTRSREDAVVSRAALATLARACGMPSPTLARGVEFWRLSADDPEATTEAAAQLEQEEAIEAFQPSESYSTVGVSTRPCALEHEAASLGCGAERLPPADAGVPSSS